MAIRKRPLENGSFQEVIVIDGLIRIITIIRLFVNGNSDFKNLYREGGKRFVDIKERMANVGMTQVDMILELQKRGYAVQPPMMSSILRGVYGRPGDGHRGSEQSDIQGGYFVPVRFFRLP